MKLRPPLEWKEVKGIFVGGCIDRGEGSSFRAKAHAHNDPELSHFGWICMRSPKRLGEYHLFDQRLSDIGVVNYQDFDGRVDEPSRLLWHEYAHILTPKHWHDDTWRAKMRELHQPMPKQYKKKKRT